MLRCVALVRTDVSLKHWFLQEPHGITSQNTAFFIVTTVKTSNLTSFVGSSEKCNCVSKLITIYEKLELFHGHFNFLLYT
jgi:hypothetical protein